MSRNNYKSEKWPCFCLLLWNETCPFPTKAIFWFFSTASHSHCKIHVPTHHIGAKNDAQNVMWPVVLLVKIKRCGKESFFAAKMLLILAWNRLIMYFQMRQIQQRTFKAKRWCPITFVCLFFMWNQFKYGFVFPFFHGLDFDEGFFYAMTFLYITTCIYCSGKSCHCDLTLSHFLRFLRFQMKKCFMLTEITTRWC